MENENTNKSFALDNESFQQKYNKVLNELDSLYNGVYDPDDGLKSASLCLLTQAPLIRIQAAAEFRAKSLKRDVEFAKAEAYMEAKKNPPEGVKVTEAVLTHAVNQDKKVKELIHDQNVAEKESRELNNVLMMLRDAHLTFRSFAKKEI